MPNLKYRSCEVARQKSERCLFEISLLFRCEGVFDRQPQFHTSLHHPTCHRLNGLCVVCKDTIAHKSEVLWTQTLAFLIGKCFFWQFRRPFRITSPLPLHRNRFIFGDVWLNAFDRKPVTVNLDISWWTFQHNIVHLHPSSLYRTHTSSSSP